MLSLICFIELRSKICSPTNSAASYAGVMGTGDVPFFRVNVSSLLSLVITSPTSSLCRVILRYFGSRAAK